MVVMKLLLHGNRAHRTKVNGCLSDIRVVFHGVLQESILGSLLFIIYINDISNYLSETKTSLYLDDIAGYCSSSSIIDIVLVL